jgi:RNA polymerase sigma factor (sigma-70 family)
MSARTDAELVQCTRAGDAAAFDELVLRHREHALAVARQHARDDETAEDAVQEAFLNAYRALASLQDGAKFGAWLGRILQRVLLQQAHGVRNDVILLSLGSMELHITVPAPEPELLELKARVRAGLSELTRRQRQVLELFYLEGLSCQEIAQRLEIPEGTVKRRLHDSRNHLRKEWIKMTDSKPATGACRQLSTWFWGNSHRETQKALQSLLAQSVALAINKQAKTAAEIAETVGAETAYVKDVLKDLQGYNLVVQNGSKNFRLNFIALDLADHQALRDHLSQVGRALADALTPQIPVVRAAYEKTSMAQQGWDWQSAQWILVTMYLCNQALRKHCPEVFDIQPPEQPDGNNYWFVGSEAPGSFGNNLSALLAVGCNSNIFPEGGTSHFWTPQVRKASIRPLGRDCFGIIQALAEGAQSIDAVVAIVSAGDTEKAAKTREMLANLIATGYVERQDDQARLLFPVYPQQDFEMLAAVLDQATAKPAREILLPGAIALDAMVAAQGYKYLADQIPAVRGSLTSELLGWTLTAVHEQGGIPQPPAEAPATFGFFAWLGVNPFFGPVVPDNRNFGSPGT